jgi:DNA helicase II / ATP-dependent DNA helicase PcrA
MPYIADFHTHSHYSYATSKHSNLVGLNNWGKIKGIQLLGTSDFTHPGWFAELRENLVDDGNGFFKLKSDFTPDIEYIENVDLRFVLTAEISCIYKKNDQTKKSHHILVVPDFQSVININHKLSAIGNLASDGRPILKLSARNLLEILLENAPEGFLIPAHIWTPWFSIFGNRSGYDSIIDCFEDLTDQIFCLETGLSADPDMIRHISALDQYTLLSNSDCHSPENLGREANIIFSDFDYWSLKNTIQFPTSKNYIHTIEFFPEEGKYYLTGHKKCNFQQSPTEEPLEPGICPVCQKPLTKGVLNRVIELSDRKRPVFRNFEKFYSIIPLKEILSEITGVGRKTKTVERIYNLLINKFGSELTLLLDLPTEKFRKNDFDIIAEAIDRMRQGNVFKNAGYDGLYGNVRLFSQTEINKIISGKF